MKSSLIEIAFPFHRWLRTNVSVGNLIDFFSGAIGLALNAPMNHQLTMSLTQERRMSFVSTN